MLQDNYDGHLQSEADRSERAGAGVRRPRRCLHSRLGWNGRRRHAVLVSRWHVLYLRGTDRFGQGGPVGRVVPRRLAQGERICSHLHLLPEIGLRDSHSQGEWALLSSTATVALNSFGANLVSYFEVSCSIFCWLCSDFSPGNGYGNWMNNSMCSSKCTCMHVGWIKPYSFLISHLTLLIHLNCYIMFIFCWFFFPLLLDTTFS